MTTALDTNVLSAMWSNEPTIGALVEALTVAKAQGTVLLSAPVYAECLAHPAYTEPRIHAFLQDTGILVDMELPDAIWIDAGRRYRQYSINRRKARGEQPRRILADFLIGAHALFHGHQLMTLDKKHYAQYFPELSLLPFAD